MNVITDLDAKAYGRLLARALPRVVETEEENEEVLAQIHRLLQKGEERSPEEHELTRLLVLLVEDFERRTYTWKSAQPTR